MRASWSVISVFVLFLVGFTANAGTQIETCSPNLTLVFSNGVWNKRTDWEKALQQTNIFFEKGSRHFTNHVNFAHPSESSGQDMLEVFLMMSRQSEYSKLTVAQKMAIYLNLTTKELNTWYSLDAKAAEALQGLRTDWNKLVQENSAESLSRLASKNIDTAVSNDIAIAKEELLSGNRLLVVAHSQGNLYANVVIRRLFSDQKLKSLRNNIKMVGVAVPADSITAADGAVSVATTDYVTRDDDGVVNRLRDKTKLVGAAAPLPANVSGDATTDILGIGHRYIEGYLQETAGTGKVVQQKLIDAYNFLAAQDPTYQVAFEVKTNLEFPQTNAVKTGLDNYLILGDESLHGENGVYAVSTVTRASAYSVAVTAKYFCRTLDSLYLGQVRALPIGMEFPKTVPAPLRVSSLVEAMGLPVLDKDGAPFSMPADSTGSTHYYQGTLDWRKQAKGATLSSR